MKLTINSIGELKEFVAFQSMSIHDAFLASERHVEDLQKRVDGLERLKKDNDRRVSSKQKRIEELIDQVEHFRQMLDQAESECESTGQWTDFEEGVSLPEYVIAGEPIICVVHNYLYPVMLSMYIGPTDEGGIKWFIYGTSKAVDPSLLKKWKRVGG